MPKSFKTQIQGLESTQADLRKRMAEMLDEEGKVAEENAAEYDGMVNQAQEVETNLIRLRAFEKMAGDAKPVPAEIGEGRPAPAVRQPAQVIEPREKLPPGTRMARAAIALCNARGNLMHAADLAKLHYKDTPEVAAYLRAAVDAGDTTTTGWATELVPAAQQMAGEFIELLRPATIIGRIDGLRRVPFNIAVPLQTGGGSYGWVGENAPKPVTRLTFSSVTLRWAKISGIIVITQELARFSSPAAEAIIRNDMVEGTARFLDTQFIDPTVAAVANVSPASITNGVTPTSTTGTTADAFRDDMATMMAAFIANNQDPTGAVVLMSATQAMRLSLMTNSLGQPEFPGINVKGGTIVGLPVVVSENVGARIILLSARDILLADDGGVRIDVSDQASVEMSDTPLLEQSPIAATTNLKSFWQYNLFGLRVERFITWLRSRTSAVEYITGAAYVP